MIYVVPEGSLGANPLPLLQESPFHSPTLCPHTFPFPYTLRCTRWTVLKYTLFSHSFMFKSLWWPLIKSRICSSACPMASFVISTQETLGSHCLLAWILHSRLASLLSYVIMAHAILQTSSFALIRNPLYSFHCWRPTSSLSSASSSKSCLTAPVYTETFLPSTPINLVKSTTI